MCRLSHSSNALRVDRCKTELIMLHCRLGRGGGLRVGFFGYV